MVQMDFVFVVLCILSILFQFMSQHFVGDCKEHFFYIYIVFGRCLEQLNFHLIGKTLSVLGDNDLLVCIVIFVTN